MKIFKNKKGYTMSFAVLLMLLTSTAIATTGSYVINQLNINQSKTLVNIANEEANNALVYGVWASNTTVAGGGHKCQWSAGTVNEVEITNEDHGLQKTNRGYQIKRYITYRGSTSNDNALLTGIARIYDDNNLLAEKAVQMNVNLLYNGNTNASSPCEAMAIEMKKDTYKEVK